MSTSFAIMAHPSREEFVQSYLQPLLPAGTPVIWDQKNDRWDTGRRCLLAGVGSGSRHHLVVQDDALLCSFFASGAHTALRSVPEDSPASFYTGKARPHGPAVARAVNRAVLSGRRWLVTRGPLWGPAAALPTSRLEEVVEACDKIDIPNYDTRMMAHFASTGTDCWYSIPSLVDHRVGDENPSLVPGRFASASRTAHAFIGYDKSPVEIDWSGRPYRPDSLEDYWYEGPLGKRCSQCGQMSGTIAEAVGHAYEHFGGGEDGDCVWVVSKDSENRDDLVAIWEELPDEVRGRAPWPSGTPGVRPWLVLVWDEDDLVLAGELPAMSVQSSDYWSDFANDLNGAGIKLQVR